MRPVSYEITQSDEALTSHSGLALIGALMGRARLAARVDEITLAERPEPAVSHGDVLTSMIGLLALGKPDFEAVEAFRDDPFFVQALGLKAVPSAATLRQRLDALAGPAVAEPVERAIREESADLVARHAPAITPCYEVADGRCGPWIALDIDVSVFDNSDTKKQGVSYTYKKVDGFAPIFAYLGQEGYLIHCQLRQGRQHSQEGAPEFIREALRQARRITGDKLLVRMDSAHDDIATVQQLQRAPKTDFIVKRNLRQESKETWLKEALVLGRRSCPRPGKEVFTGSLIGERKDVCEQIVFEVVRRTTRADGQVLLIPEIEVQTWWTNLAAPPEDVIRLYREHSTSEQFHSELKTDLDLERLPSGKFATNALLLLLGMMAYNALRLCGQISLGQARHRPADKQGTLRKKAGRRRLRSVLLDLMYQAARWVCHGRRFGLSFGRFNPWYDVWRGTYLRVRACA